MIGIAFGYPSELDRGLYNLPNELRFARIEIGEVFENKGRIIGPYYWRKWELPLEEKNTLAKEILEIVGHRPREIDGFTLFYQSSVYTKADGTKTDGPGFQMSVRRKGESGWDVKIIPESEAMKVFSLLRNTGHPDGPWTLTDEMKADVRDSYIVPQSAIEGWPQKESPQTEEEPDLLSLLGAAERAVQRRNVVQATPLPDKV